MKIPGIKSFSGWVAIVIVASGVFFSLPNEAEAKVRGVCSNCHTMHNSQAGVSMILGTVTVISAPDPTLACSGCHAKPRENLLRLDCIGCHAKDVTGSHVWSLGGDDVPQVYHGEDLAGPNSMAAGNFYWVSQDDAHGHNVHGFGNSLIASENVMPLPNVAPGYVAQMDPGTPNFEDWPAASSAVPDQILCAGAYGCHGNRQIESQTQAMQGTHHADDEQYLQLGTKTGMPAEMGSTPGLSYRYLSGVLGGEEPDWEWGATRTKHNEYYGKELIADPRPSGAVTGVESMSEFCASCHGNFHQYNSATPDAGIGTTAVVTPLTAGAMSPWIRHPTDIRLPPDGEFAAYVSYKLEAPIARTVVPDSALAAARPGASEPIVFCLSCHRAHASEYYDSLRFSYAQMITGTMGAGAGNGCFACHSDKDGI